MYIKLPQTQTTVASAAVCQNGGRSVVVNSLLLSVRDINGMYPKYRYILCYIFIKKHVNIRDEFPFFEN